ncbi:MAG: 4'-phosphopantetheinyl transferase superfamily protein [Flavobacteriaceae bacterium]|nr:4'-phosphopantetheinyl transferase superfamily protein [Flavobacteriaceae bacterium]
MVGNDIVDLKQAEIESNWRRKGFLDKMFTKNEQSFILNVDNSFEIVWQLWSMKESAYKMFVQQYSHRFFNPLKLQCELLSKTVGVVTVSNEKYYTKSIITEDYIYTVATLKGESMLLDGCFKIERNKYANQHQEIYNQLKLRVSKRWNLPFQDLNIIKNRVGVPKLFQNEKKIAIDFSITHHGCYIAFAITP